MLQKEIYTWERGASGHRGEYSKRSFWGEGLQLTQGVFCGLDGGEKVMPKLRGGKDHCT